MPIYAYRCERCGHAKDVLQKVSDPVLTVCPSCTEPAFRKQVTAAGFQLKGSGWYVTDYAKKGAGETSSKGETRSDPKGETKSDSKTETKSDSKAEKAPASKSSGE